MTSTISALTTGGGGIVMSGDSSGNLSLLSGATTVVAVTSTGATVTGTLAVSGGVTLTTTLPVLQGGTGVTTSTGTGAGVHAATPVFTTTIGVGAATASASGSGITFPATQSASTNANTLDDYEEGTWTPTMTTSSTPATFTYPSRGGNYTKVGRSVTAWFYCSVSVSVAGIGLVGVETSSLPFAPASDNLSSSLYARGGFTTSHPTGATASKIGWNNDNPASSLIAYFQTPTNTNGGATTGMQTGVYAGYLFYEAST